MTDITLGGRLRYRRRQLGLTLRELAQLTGMSASGLCRLERDKGSMTVRTLVQLCKALRVSVDYVLAGVPREALNFHLENGLLPTAIVRACAKVPFAQALRMYWMMKALQEVRDDPTPLEQIDWIKFYAAVKPWLP